MLHEASAGFVGSKCDQLVDHALLPEFEGLSL